MSWQQTGCALFAAAFLLCVLAVVNKARRS